MYKLSLVFLCLLSLLANAQNDRIVLGSAKFRTGDDKQWASPSFNDEGWATIKSNENWEDQGFENYNGFAWYRFSFNLPSSLKSHSFLKDSLRIFLARIDDADEVFLNGRLIAKDGAFPSDKDGYITVWDLIREFHISTIDQLLNWDRSNLLAVRVYDGGGAGGIFSAIPFINMIDIVDGIQLTGYFDADQPARASVVITNNNKVPLNGQVKVTTVNTNNNSVLQSITQKLTIGAHARSVFTLKSDPSSRTELKVRFTETNTGKSLSLEKTSRYILTPKPSARPRINGAMVYGARPGSPFLYKIAATGTSPITYTASGLPAGLVLDLHTGVISGRIEKVGDIKVKISASNNAGSAQKELLIRCGDLLALTPPMGWNSWNCWGLSVSDKKLRASAQAMIDKGLIDHGWTYVNIDDGWEDSVRNNNESISANAKFPDMQGLGNWLHSKGLKFGIYSSPGPRTCGGYLGSYQHEKDDANTYAGWGIDYLKYDWCSYGSIHDSKDTSFASYMKPYQVMQNALRSQKRDIIYSLCQYGMKNVWQWGDRVDGNCWRTTGDIEDTWESLKSIGFNQDKMSAYAKNGRWNDPDMLIVGEVGWGEHLHPTRLTPDEQYTHISLWCLLSAPLLIGCDMSKLDNFTLNLLTNDELIDINQDPLGKQANQIIKTDMVQVWSKELQDGTKAVGLFNLSEKFQKISVPVKELGLGQSFSLRDCWRQKDLGKYNTYSANVPPHGVVVLKIY